MASFRPSDAISSDSASEAAPAENARLGPVGFLRFMWRQLDEHAHGPGSAAPTRPRGRAGIARAAALVRPERRLPVPGGESRAVRRAELLRTVQHLLDPVVLGDLPVAVRVADRLHHSALEAPPRRAAGPPPEDPRPPLAARGFHRTANDDGCRDRGCRGTRGSQEPGLPRRTVRRLDLGRARLPAGDGQPDLPHGSRRRARGRRHRRGVRIHRAAAARRGGAVHERARRLRLVHRRVLGRPRHLPRTVLPATRRVRGQLRVRRSRWQRGIRSISRPR